MELFPTASITVDLGNLEVLAKTSECSLIITRLNVRLLKKNLNV